MHPHEDRAPAARERLADMAAQIAASAADQERVAELTAQHLTTFWTPTMIDVLRRHATERPDEVASVVQEALGLTGGSGPTSS
jgi:alkylation response protein AidB-like acyl-CoA dehydrogenase